jgi:hypothetical protein
MDGVRSTARRECAPSQEIHFVVNIARNFMDKMMKSWFGFLLMMCLFSLTPVSAQESREAFLAGLRAAIQNPKNWIDVYQRTQQPEFAAIIKEAAQSGDQTLVKELLGAAIGENRQQHPPLVIAVIHRDIEIIRAVLDMGAFSHCCLNAEPIRMPARLSGLRP